MKRFMQLLVPFACVSLFLAGCSSGGGGGGGATSLSGTILGPTGTGIQGVVVTVSTAASSASATTDANGNFIVLRPPTGLADLHIEGDNAPGGMFANLELSIIVGGGATNLAQPVVLPDLSAGTTMSVPVDVNGQTIGATTVDAPDGSSLDIPDMTTITVDGAIPPGPVDVNVTSVPAINVPMPLPGTQDPGAFVTIQPPGATFNPALGITLPNTRGFPLGTMVDIWSFDHQDAAWVNRSEQTGNQGTVMDIGGNEFIVAMGVITEGGWHAATLPVDPACATTIAGQVFSLGSSTTLRDVLISLSTGQFARTDANGRFSITSVPAYDASMLPATCIGSEIMLRAIAPVSFGAMTADITIGAGTIVTGGVTNIPAFDIATTSTGSLVGSASESGQGVEGTVSITGTATLDVETDALGTFFVASLNPGPYTATFSFDTGDVSKDFTIVANQTTTVSLTAGPPPAGGALTVRVLEFETSSAGTPIPDACITLQGGGGAPMFMTADGNGEAVFAIPPAGPYTVTAQKDTTTGFGISRLGATLVGVNPTALPRTIVIPIFDDGAAPLVVTDATFDGTILNAPVGADLRYQIVTEAGGGFGSENAVFGTNFMVSIPSGLPLDVAVSAADGITGEILSAVFAPGVMATSGQTVMLDLDFANACLFDRPVTLTYTNVQSPGDFFAELELRGVGVLEFPFSDGSSLPADVNWPNLAAAKLSGFDAFFDTGTSIVSTTFAESYCELPLGNTTRTSLQVGFLGVPTIAMPANNAVFATYGPGNTVQYTLGSGNGTSTGFNSVTFAGESESGDLQTFWDILVPTTTTSFVIPPVFAGKPMFPPGFYAVNVGAVRFDFPGFAFATAFDQNLPSVVAAVRESEFCEGDKSHFFMVSAPPVMGGDEPMRLRKRAAIANRFGTP